MLPWLQVGDIVQVHKNHSIPCDMILLSSDNEDGMCYITTANLDGETNNKVTLTFLHLSFILHFVV